MSGVAPKAEKPVFLTGSGSKMEFDVDLCVEMQRVNQVVGCKMSIMANQTSIARDEFQVTQNCLKKPDQPGLRFQIVPIGLQVDEQIDVRLSWVSSGSTNVDGE